MTTDTNTHDVVVTQRYSDRHHGDANGATIHSVVITSQVAGQKGIERQLQLEVTQPQKVNGAKTTMTVRRILSWEELEQLGAVADRLVSAAETWRSTPNPRRSSIEFSTTVADGFAIGRQMSNQGPEYFVALRDEGQTARCVLGGVEQLNEFVAHLLDAALQLR